MNDHAVTITVTACLIAWLGGIMFALGLFPYATGKVPRVQLVASGLFLIAVSIAAVVMGT